MSQVSAKQLALMRAAVERLLPDTCTIKQISRVDDVTGKKHGTTTLATNVACRVDPVSADDEASLGLNAKALNYRITTKYNSALDRNCIVEHAGHTYEIWEMEKEQSWATCRRALGKRIDTT